QPAEHRRRRGGHGHEPVGGGPPLPLHVLAQPAPGGGHGRPHHAVRVCDSLALSPMGYHPRVTYVDGRWQPALRGWLSFLMLAGAGCAHEAGGPAVPAASATDAPEPEGMSAIRSPCGALVVVNDGALHFTVEVAGTSVRLDTTPDAPFYVIDDLNVRIG